MPEPWYLLIANEEIGDYLRIMVCGIVVDSSQELVLRRTGPYDPHHGAAEVDIDFNTAWLPPLPCMRWFVPQ